MFSDEHPGRITKGGPGWVAGSDVVREGGKAFSKSKFEIPEGALFFRR